MFYSPFIYTMTVFRWSLGETREGSHFLLLTVWILPVYKYSSGERETISLMLSFGDLTIYTGIK